MPGIVAYAPGFGRGHTTRVAAVLRRLADIPSLVVCTDGSPEPLEAHDLDHVATTLDSAPDILRASEPDLLVVDCWPAGQRGELIDLLRDLTCPRVLIWRSWPANRRMGAETVLGHYDRILSVEGRDSLVGVTCPPVLIRDADELLPRVEARRILGVGDADVALAVVTPNHGAQNLDALVAGIDESETPLLRVHHTPLIEYMNGIDGLIGTAGYSLFHEAAATRVPARFAWRVRAGDQPVRCPTPADPIEVRTWARSLVPRHGAAADYDNGAHRVAWHIRRLLRA